MTKLFSEEVKTRAIGGVRQTLGYKDFSLIKIIYPPHAVIEEFNRFYSTLVETKRMMIQESRRLAELRDALLPRLMSGELRVSDVEQLEELA